MNLTALIIQGLHLLFILFVLFGIFVNDPLFLLLYLFTLITLQLHWFMNNDICFLTLVEGVLTGRTGNESFMHRLVSPIYKIPDRQLANISKIVVYVLIFATLIKLYRIGMTPRKYYDMLGGYLGGFLRPAKSPLTPSG